MNIVGAALGNGVDNAAHGVAILSREVVGDNLKLLHGLLGDGAGDAGTPRVLVVELVGGVIAISEEAVVSGDAAEAEQTKGSVRHDGGAQQHEGVHAAGVDGQLQDLSLVNQLRNVGLGILHGGSCGVHIDRR